MCLGIPAKIIKIDENLGIVEIDGIRRQASFELIENPKVGEYVILHAGFAIQKIDEKEAKETLNLLSSLEVTQGF